MVFKMIVLKWLSPASQTKAWVMLVNDSPGSDRHNPVQLDAQCLTEYLASLLKYKQTKCSVVN